MQLNGRLGQPQSGVDVFGRRVVEGGAWVGVQCKGKESWPGSKLTKAEVRREVKKAHQFKPTLSEFIIVTTAPIDAKIQQVAREITEEQKSTRQPLSVAVWGWGEIENKIIEYPRALNAFHPDATPFSREILSGIDRIEAQLVKRDDSITSRLDQIFAIVRPTVIGDTSDGSAIVASAVDNQLHAEIDGYRNLIQ